MPRLATTIALSLLLLSGCGSFVMPVGNTMLNERMMTVEEARAHCKATAHSPFVHLGIDPNYIKIMPHAWSWQGVKKLGEYFERSTMIWTVNHTEPLYHEASHRGMALAGEHLANPLGMFRDDEHARVYHILDRDFPGLQDWRIHSTIRKRAKARLTTPENAASLAAAEQRAATMPSWCKSQGGK